MVLFSILKSFCCYKCIALMKAQINIAKHLLECFQKLINYFSSYSLFTENTKLVEKKGSIYVFYSPFLFLRQRHNSIIIICY